MSLPNLLKKLHTHKLELLLPLPALLIAFAFGGEALTNILLSRSYPTMEKLQADMQPVQVKVAGNLTITKVEIEKEGEFSEVELQTENSVLKKLYFQVESTQLSQVKAVIAQELGVSQPVEILQANRPMKVRFAGQVLGILAEIDNLQGFTKVEVNTANSVLKKLEFEFPVTELNSVKAMMNQELGISAENARLFVSYRFKN